MKDNKNILFTLKIYIATVNLNSIELSAVTFDYTLVKLISSTFIIYVISIIISVIDQHILHIIYFFHSGLLCVSCF